MFNCTNHYPTNPFSNKPIQYPLVVRSTLKRDQTQGVFGTETPDISTFSGQEVEGRSQHQWSESPTKIPRNPWTYGSLMLMSMIHCHVHPKRFWGGRSISTHIFRLIFIFIYIDTFKMMLLIVNCLVGWPFLKTLRANDSMLTLSWLPDDGHI